MHPVGDVEQRQPLASQPLQHHEHFCDVGGRQRRRRLVEDEDAGLSRQRLGDLDDLAARQGQVLDQRHRVDVLGAGAGQRPLGEPPLRAPVDHAEPQGRMDERDVVGDREIGNQRQFLEDADDSGAARRRRRIERDRSAVEDDTAGVRRDDARQDLDQRRLARSVLAEDRVDAAGRNGEAGVVERPDAAIALRHGLHLQDRRPRFGCRHRPRSPHRTKSAPPAGGAMGGYLFSLDWPMISAALNSIPQVGKELPTKKLSDRFE